MTHLHLLGIVSVGLALFDDLDGKFIQLIEVVRCMRDNLALDIEQREILDDGLLELGLQHTISNKRGRHNDTDVRAPSSGLCRQTG